MKIALVHPKFDTLGGAEYYAHRLAAGLVSRGHEVHLYARRVKPVPDGATVHLIPAVPLGRALKALTFSWLAAERLGRSDYDLVQGLGKTACQTVHRTGGGVHRAYVEEARPGRRSFYDRVAIRIEDQLYRSPRLKAVICAAPLIASQVEQYYPQIAPKVRIIPTGVDTGDFSPEGRELDRLQFRERLGLSADAVVLLFLGTNFQRKGLALAVDALPQLPNVHLAVGGGDAPESYEAQAAALGVQSRVHFIGFQAVRPPVYRAADVFVLPTNYDPFANVCLEALACGTPVVTSDRNGAASILEGETAGEVSPLAQGGSGVAACTRALLARKLKGSKKARELALRYDQRRHVDAVEELYREVLCENVGVDSKSPKKPHEKI